MHTYCGQLGGSGDNRSLETRVRYTTRNHHHHHHHHHQHHEPHQPHSQSPKSSSTATSQVVDHDHYLVDGHKACQPRSLYKSATALVAHFRRAVTEMRRSLGMESSKYSTGGGHSHHYPHSHRVTIVRLLKAVALFVVLTVVGLTAVVITRTLLVAPPHIDHHCAVVVGGSGVSANDGANDGTTQPPSTSSSPSSGSTKAHKAITADRGVIERFQQVLRYRTITKAPKHYSVNETLQLIEFLKTNFTLVHSSPLVTLELVNGLSLLYHVRGSNPSLKPYMLLAHLDVVPVQENMWTVPPFEGRIKDGYIYGRGTLDLKSVVMALLESLEFILENRTPIERSFYIAIGHDEEGRGLDGAQQIAHHMTATRRADLEFILDEGPFIYRNALPGVSHDVAMVGVAEKGLVNMRLSVTGTVGHSSVPPKETAIVKLAKAVAKLNADAHPNHFGEGPERDMVESLAPYASWPYRLLYTNLWLFRPLVARLLEADKLMNSFVRTTTAVTIFNSGIKDNVLPGKAEATVNHRIYPLNRVADVLAHDRHIIDDPDISVEVLGVAIEPHPISPYGDTSFGYQSIRKSIQQVFGPSTAIIPGMMIAATDTRWYLNFTRNIYRFSPGYVTLDSMSIIHGHDERISTDNYLKLVNFYHHVILNANKATLEHASSRDEF